MKQLIKIFILLFPIITFGQTGTQTNNTLTFDGKTREYILYVPASYDGETEFPLVINLHGYGSDMTQQMLYADFRPIADTANFILVVPNALQDLLLSRKWNHFNDSAEDDIGFLLALVDKLSDDYSINENRIYSTGMSNGGVMSYYLACAASERLTAIASVTGALVPASTCSPTVPTPIMEIHGTADNTVPYLGGLINIPIPDVIDKWVEINQCDETPIVTHIPNINTTDGSTVEHYLYENGINGNTVELFKIIGGGHTWPGGLIDLPLNGNTNRDINACKEIWRFFSQFPKTIDDGTNEIKVQESFFSIYPNPSSGRFYLETSELIEDLFLINSEGKMIEKQQNILGKIEFTNLSKGIYFLQLYSNTKSQIRKVIVE